MEPPERAPPVAAPRPPPDLRPPGLPPSGREAGARPAWTGPLLLVGALGLALVALLQLPQWLQPSTPVPAAGPPPAASTQPAPAVDAQRLAAEQALQGYLKRRAELERLRADAWAAPELARAAAATGAGDRLFGQRRFGEAAAQYAAAETQLAQLDASRPQRLAAALAAGWKALADDDGPAAVQQFTLALALAPDHEEAARGLARAEVRDAVLERMAAGRLAEASAQPEAAVQAYRAAADLDPEFAPAAAAAERVAATQAERAFATAMSRALEALEAGRFGAAAQALEQAAALRPGERVVVDARRRLAAARHAAELDRLRREADRLAAAEAWDAAAARYDAALQIDPAAGFAHDGSAHATQRARLHTRLDLYLEEPQRLFSPGPLGEAERLLAEVRPLPADQPRLAAKVERLAGLVATATTPRQVTLRSDGQTEVTVHHVGGLGRFGERQLALRPGSYTAVGARPGYRDIRVTFTVAADGPPPVVDVRCREPL
jgi:hypothetical protein